MCGTCGVGITRDSIHKRRKTGGKINHWRKKRKYDLGRQAANTKLGGKRVHLVRVRGGNYKFRALRLETGNFTWATESTLQCCCKQAVVEGGVCGLGGGWDERSPRGGQLRWVRGVRILSVLPCGVATTVVRGTGGHGLS